MRKAALDGSWLPPPAPPFGLYGLGTGWLGVVWAVDVPGLYGAANRLGWGVYSGGFLGFWVMVLIMI